MTLVNFFDTNFRVLLPTDTAPQSLLVQTKPFICINLVPFWLSSLDPAASTASILVTSGQSYVVGLFSCFNSALVSLVKR